MSVSEYRARKKLVKNLVVSVTALSIIVSGYIIIKTQIIDKDKHKKNNDKEERFDDNDVVSVSEQESYQELVNREIDPDKEVTYEPKKEEPIIDDEDPIIDNNDSYEFVKDYKSEGIETSVENLSTEEPLPLLNSIENNYTDNIIEEPVIEVLPTMEAARDELLIEEELPTVRPFVRETAIPTIKPTIKPTAVPTMVPTERPTVVPTEEPTVVPTEEPTIVPTEEPTVAPTVLNGYKVVSVPTYIPTYPPSERLEEELNLSDPSNVLDSEEYDELETYLTSIDDEVVDDEIIEDTVEDIPVLPDPELMDEPVDTQIEGRKCTKKTTMYRQSNQGFRVWWNGEKCTASGCSLVASVNAIRIATGNSLTPSELNQLGKDGKFYGGSRSKNITEYLDYYDLEYDRINKSDEDLMYEAFQLVKEGKATIIFRQAMKTGEGKWYTKKGHYFNGIDAKCEDGVWYIKLSDPAGGKRENGWINYKKVIKPVLAGDKSITLVYSDKCYRRTYSR